ncbi:hypothetical protein E5Q_05054 [Mixia osmundae IAM 14324]|uniref:Peptidase A1 domain-containing protein n=1 Tax=Mixia osmundae (strain CBS 9802 / IAM 14324 / JCM 22182 / KY 12970) TaxID=764103 RepID=G7E6A8_MIXOS|nr:hypothetical protein E5Q_05054 [Mixia osmundae IAM 14324]
MTCSIALLQSLLRPILLVHRNCIQKQHVKMQIALQLLVAAAYVADASVIKLRAHQHRHHHRHHLVTDTFLPTRSFQDSSFYVNLTVGTTHPVTYENVMLDSGSGPTWVRPYKPGPSAVASNVLLAEIFADGTSAIGNFYTDQVAVGDVHLKLAFGGIPGQKGHESPDPSAQGGIIGIGPQSLQDDVVTDGGGKAGQYPNFMGSLVKAGLIKRNVIGLGFSMADLWDASPVDKGGIVLGGIDTSVLKSEVTYSPHLPPWINALKQSRNYWGVSMQFPTAGSTSATSKDAYTVIDTGTTLTTLRDANFLKWADPIPGMASGKFGIYGFPKSSIPLVPALDFIVGGKRFSVPGKELIMSDEYAAAQGLDTKSLAYTHVTNAGGLDLNIFGAIMLTKFYVVLDDEEKRIGFALTAHSPAQSA